MGYGIQWAGAHYEPGASFYAVEYGLLSYVLRSTACNYSYREFWF
jgi:hypothetical protein